MIRLVGFVVFWFLFLGIHSSGRAQENPIDPQRVVYLREVLRLKQLDLQKRLDLSQDLLEKLRISLAQILGRAHMLHRVFDLQRRYGGEQAAWKKGHLFLCLKRALMREWEHFLSERETCKTLEKQKLRLNAAFHSFDLYFSP